MFVHLAECAYVQKPKCISEVEEVSNSPTHPRAALMAVSSELAWL